MQVVQSHSMDIFVKMTLTFLPTGAVRSQPSLSLLGYENGYPEGENDPTGGTVVVVVIVVVAFVVVVIVDVVVIAIVVVDFVVVDVDIVVVGVVVVVVVD